MKEDELDNLFQKFLNRKPNNKETIWHLNKGLTEFENELFGCDESNFHQTTA